MSKLVKLTVSFKRKAGLTDEEFHKYWSEDHARIFMSMPIAKTNVVKYVQFHVDPAISAAAGANAEVPLSQFDGSAIFYGRSFEELFAVFVDPEYYRLVLPDEELFMDRSSAQFMIGYDEEKWVHP